MNAPATVGEPDNQQQALDLMIERARFMTSQPGCVSITLHRSKDGSHPDQLHPMDEPGKPNAAHQSPGFRKKWPQFGDLANEIKPCLYEVVFTEAA
jgi:hypothetical protein